MSKYQIATKPGHRSSEHIYVLKSMIGMMEMKKKAVIVTMWDLKSYFDTENLIDCMSELYKSNVKGKTYRLLYKLNKTIRISVKTPVGETEKHETEDNVGQGTVEGAIISSANLDGGVTEFFDKDKSEDEVTEADDPENNDDAPSDFYHPCLFQVS